MSCLSCGNAQADEPCLKCEAMLVRALVWRDRVDTGDGRMPKRVEVLLRQCSDAVRDSGVFHRSGFFPIVPIPKGMRPLSIDIHDTDAEFWP